jgi:hypothetical protein
MLTVFSDSPFGFHVGFFEHYLTANNGAKVSGAVPEGSATVNLNFTAKGDRVSIGIGYVLESQSGLTCTGNCPAIPSTTSGPVIELKEDHGKSGLFGLAQVFVPNDESRNTLHRIQTFVGLGFQFGQSK